MKILNDKNSEVAIYRRVSTKPQVPRFGLEQQLTSCQNRLIKIGFQDFRLFTDEGMTGENLNRKGLQSLCKAVKAGKIKVVIAYSISRYSRNFKEFWPILNEWNESDVRVLTVLEGFDSTFSIEKQLRKLLSFACRADKIALKAANKAKDKKVKKGGRGAGNIPYGYYALANGRLAINPEQAEIVKKIFIKHSKLNKHGKNISDQKIAGYLTDKNVAPPSWDPDSGKPIKPWGKTTIESILTNPKYIGIWVQQSNGEEIISYDIAPAIIEDLSLCDRMKSRWLKLAKNRNKRIGGTLI